MSVAPCQLEDPISWVRSKGSYVAVIMSGASDASASIRKSFIPGRNMLQSTPNVLVFLPHVGFDLFLLYRWPRQ